MANSCRQRQFGDDKIISNEVWDESEETYGNVCFNQKNLNNSNESIADNLVQSAEYTIGVKSVQMHFKACLKANLHDTYSGV